MRKKKLGEVLRDRGEITSEDLFVAIAEQQGKMMHLGELMLERGFVEKEALAAALEEISHIPYVKKWNSFRPALASLIRKPFKKCRPICGKEKRLRCG